MPEVYITDVAIVTPFVSVSRVHPGEWEMQKTAAINKRMARLPVSPADTGSLAITDMETICLK